MSDKKRPKQIVIPETMTITLPYNVVQRLKCFGKEESTFSQILTDFMDAADNKVPLSKVSKPKEYMRQGAHYQKLLTANFFVSDE